MNDLHDMAGLLRDMGMNVFDLRCSVTNGPEGMGTQYTLTGWYRHARIESSGPTLAELLKIVREGFRNIDQLLPGLN